MPGAHVLLEKKINNALLHSGLAKSVMIVMTCHFIVFLAIIFSCSSMVVLGVELSCNQSSNTCPGRNLIQCECQVTNGNLQWSAMIPGDPQSEDVIIETYSFISGTGVPTSSGPYTTVLCSVVTSPVTLTSKLTVTSTNAVDVSCRSGSGDIDTTRLTVAGI